MEAKTIDLFTTVGGVRFEDNRIIIEDSEDEVLLRRLWAIIDQVRDLFLKPELIEGILTSK